MTYIAISVVGMDIYVVTDRIVSQWKLWCCPMVVTIYQGVVKLSPPTWQHHHLMIASTIASIIQWQMTMHLGAINCGKTNPRLDASLLQCTLRSRSTALIPTSPTTSSPRPATAVAQSSGLACARLNNQNAAYALEQCGLLLRDANLLYQSGSYASAVALAAFAQEELGRWKMLLDLRKKVVDGDHLTVEQIRTRCGDHVRKQEAG